MSTGSNRSMVWVCPECRSSRVAREQTTVSMVNTPEHYEGVGIKNQTQTDWLCLSCWWAGGACELVDRTLLVPPNKARTLGAGGRFIRLTKEERRALWEASVGELRPGELCSLSDIERYELYVKSANIAGFGGMTFDHIAMVEDALIAKNERLQDGA